MGGIFCCRKYTALSFLDIVLNLRKKEEAINELQNKTLNYNTLNSPLVIVFHF